MRFLNTSFVINNASTTSTPPIDTSNVGTISAQAVFTDGAAAGSMEFQGSNDVSETNAPTHWSVIGTPATVAAGATTMLPELSVTYRYTRVTFISSGGAGTITVSVEGEGV